VSGYWIHTLPPNPESTGTTPVLTKSTTRLDRWVDHLSMQTNYGEETSQILLARRIGKTRIIAETGAGQHGVVTATVCARFGMECVIYMGAEDVRRQALNVFRIEMLGAKVTPSMAVHQHLNPTLICLYDALGCPSSCLPTKRRGAGFKVTETVCVFCLLKKRHSK